MADRESAPESLSMAQLILGQATSLRRAAFAVQDKAPAEQKRILASWQVCVLRLSSDPGFYRFVWRSINADPGIRRQRKTLMELLRNEFLQGSVSISNFVRDENRRRRDADAADPVVHEKSVRRVVQEYLPDVFLRSEENRGELASVFSANLGLPPPRARPPIDPRTRYLRKERPEVAFQHILEVLPESYRWTAGLLRDWNSAGRRSHPPNPYDYPRDENEAKFLDLAGVVLTTYSFPNYWFLRLSDKRRVRLLERHFPFEFDDKDAQELAERWSERGRDEQLRFETTEDAAWALVQGRYPRQALALTQNATAGRFGPSSCWQRLWLVAGIALQDLNRPRRALAAAAALREYGRKESDDLLFRGQLMRVAILAANPRLARGELDAYITEAASPLQRHPDPYVRAQSLAHLAWEVAAAGREKRAIELLDSAGDAAAQTGNVEVMGLVTHVLTNLPKPANKRLHGESGELGRDDKNTKPRKRTKEEENKP